jgi:hypothetical protein
MDTNDTKEALAVRVTALFDHHSKSRSVKPVNFDMEPPDTNKAPAGRGKPT